MSGEELEKNIVDTVATAGSVLSHFEDSLIRAGFSDAAQQYSRLADTLIAQMLWAQSSGVPDMSRFRGVGERARAIHAILAPYAATFRRLSVLAEADGDDVDQSVELKRWTTEQSDSEPEDGRARQEDASRLLAYLVRHGGKASGTAIRADLRMGRVELKEAIDLLSEHGAVTVSMSNGREIIRGGVP